MHLFMAENNNVRSTGSLKGRPIYCRPPFSLGRVPRTLPHVELSGREKDFATSILVTVQ